MAIYSSFRKDPRYEPCSDLVVRDRKGTRYREEQHYDHMKNFVGKIPPTLQSIFAERIEYTWLCSRQSHARGNAAITPFEKRAYTYRVPVKLSAPPSALSRSVKMRVRKRDIDGLQELQVAGQAKHLAIFNRYLVVQGKVIQVSNDSSYTSLLVLIDVATSECWTLVLLACGRSWKVTKNKAQGPCKKNKNMYNKRSFSNKKRTASFICLFVLAMVAFLSFGPRGDSGEPKFQEYEEYSHAFFSIPDSSAKNRPNPPRKTLNTSLSLEMTGQMYLKSKTG